MVSALPNQDIIPENFAKVMVWDSNVHLRDTGHVSLQTANTYISLWPDYNSDNKNQHTLCVNTKEYVLTLGAPLLATSSYQQDITLAGRACDHTYMIKLDIDRVNLFWQQVLLKITADQNRGKIFGWYDHGGHQLDKRQHVIDTDKVYMNSALSALITLSIGGVDANYFSQHQSHKHYHKVCQSFKNLIVTSNPTLIDRLSRLSNLSQTVLIEDIKAMLDDKVKDALYRGIKRRVKLQELMFENLYDDDMVIHHIATKLAAKTKSDVIDLEYLKEVMQPFGHFETISVFKPSSRMKYEINQLRDDQYYNAIHMTLGAIAVGTAGLVAYKTNCTII